MQFLLQERADEIARLEEQAEEVVVKEEIAVKEEIVDVPTYPPQFLPHTCPSPARKSPKKVSLTPGKKKAVLTPGPKAFGG